MQVKGICKRDPEANVWANGKENGEWRRLHIEQLHSLLPFSNLVRVIKSRRSRWADHVAKMEEGRSAFKMLTGKTTGKRFVGSSRPK